jgi:Ca2+-binding RTX toxin-like protein
MASFNAPISGGTVKGTASADIITGSAAADVLWGLGGDDQINGGDGDDIIEGDGASSGKLADVISTIGSYIVPLNSQPNSNSRPELKFLGNTADAKTVWGIFNTTNQPITITLTTISDYKFATGRVPFGPITFLVPANSEYIIASPSSKTHDISVNGVHVADADPKLNQPFNNPLVVDVGGVDGNDILNGGNGNDTINGGGGNDILIGGSGADKLNGGTGTDTADYSASTSGVTINLSAGTGVGGDAQGDTLTGIENIIGSKFNDTLMGDGNANVLTAGDGIDTISYANATAGVAFSQQATDGYGIGGQYTNLAAGGYSGDAKGDSYSGFEIVIGSAFADRIGGSDTAETYYLGAGDDVYDNVYTKNVVDTVYGEAGNDTMWTGGGDDVLSGGDGNDNLYGETGNDLIKGDAGDDNIGGGDGDDRIIGGAGADTINGGAGNDTADYSASSAGVNVNLETGIGKGGDAEGDKLSGIENLIGSKFNDVLTGNGDVNMIDGGDGDDTITGGHNNDKMFGGAGNDTFIVEWSYHGDTYDGGSGIDTFNADIPVLGAYVQEIDLATGTNNWEDKFISIENLVGGANNDKFWGTDGENSFWGRGGNDLLDGRGGNDKLFGEEGNDVIIGGAGADQIDGGNGSDTAVYASSVQGVNVNLTTGTGNGGDAEGDTLKGIENLIGSNFNDTLTGDAGGNTLDGGDGDDILSGGAGADALLGGKGNDTSDYSNSTAAVTVNLATAIGSGGDAEGDKYASIENVTGSKFDDQLFGDAGSNTLDGGAGNDLLSGGAGADKIIGGLGSDTADYSGSIAAVNVSLVSGSGTGGDAQGDVLSGIENLNGSKFNDVLIGDAGVNVLSGGYGDDLLVGGKGDDVLDGGEGRDTADFSGSEACLNVDLTTGVAISHIKETDKLISIENVIGTKWGDNFRGDKNANNLFGLDGNDRFFGSGGGDFYDGGEGRDWLDYRFSTENVKVSLQTGLGYGGLAEGDTFKNIENLRGGSGDDYLAGDKFSNIIYDGAGSDTVEAGAGNDIIYSVGGYDRLDGGEGIDTVTYADSWDRVVVNLETGIGQYGAASRDTLVNVENLTGTRFDDTLIGDAGKNTLKGGGGQDTLKGGAGDDILIGGQSADKLQGDDGADTASYTNAHTGVTLSLAKGGTVNADSSQDGRQPLHVDPDNCPESFATGDGTDYVDASYTTVGGVTDATGDTYVSIENVLGSAWNDKITGDDNINRLNGGAGNDVLDGAGGNDYLIGGLGKDTLIGGQGADVFVFDGSFGQDSVTDFWAGAGRTDRVWFTNTDIRSYADVLAHTTDTAAGLVISVNGGADSITLAGIHLSQLNADDFLF